MPELTQEQVDRQDEVANACYDLLVGIAPKDSNIPWDIESIGEVINACQEVICGQLKLMLPQDFYPWVPGDRKPEQHPTAAPASNTYETKGVCPKCGETITSLDFAELHEYRGNFYVFDDNEGKLHPDYDVQERDKEGEDHFFCTACGEELFNDESIATEFLSCEQEAWPGQD